MFLNMFGILIEMGKRSAFSKKDSAFECPSGENRCVSGGQTEAEERYD